MTVASPTPRSALDRGAVFRLCRILHGYVSAFAFLTLLFFAVTGVLLNHPEWFESYSPAERELSTTLSRDDLGAALKAADPGRALAQVIGGRIALRGAYSSADQQDGRMLVRLEGPKGSSDIDIDLGTGAVKARVETANLTAVMLDLHRGKNSGSPWRWLIDVSAILIVALSLIGFVLFFSLRLRLRNSLILTGAGFTVLAAFAIWLVR